MRIRTKLRPAFLALCALASTVALASITGSISGLVTDPSGAVVVGAMVTATETQTGVQASVKTDDKGFYNFSALPIGVYNIDVAQAGFKAFRQSGITIDANSAVRVDIKLEVGAASEHVTVSSEALHVETQSTQMGEVIDSAKMTSLPLNGRAFTDLLSLQPGVVPFQYANQVQIDLGGLNDRSVSGNLNPGNQSVNGQRQASNGFMVDGANVEEGKNNGTAIIPNLDSISEFRIITNNFDAEYGNYSGGQINVATKSGTNDIHGDAFEFLRNTDLDARNFFDTTAAGKFNQNQFGGTLGAPIKKDKSFFFVDYQGTRLVQGATQNYPVPSDADRTGDLADQATALASASEASLPNASGPGLVSGPFFANILTNRLGYTVTAGEPYYTGPTPDQPNAPACTSNTQCVFPNAVIPQKAWSSAAKGLLPFVPQSNSSTGNFTTNAFNEHLRDDKGGIRVDENTRYGQIFGYYFLDDYLRNDPYPSGGATAPGFNAITPGRAQLLNLGDTKPFGSSSVNEFHFSYTRDAGTYFKPQGSVGTTLSSLGFVTPWGPAGGLAAIDPAFQGVPSVVFNNFTIGVPSDSGGQFNNTFQWQDNFSKVVGTHTIKFGGQFHYDQINERNYFGENGDFTFSGTETGLDFADFLIGAPSSFIQASRQILDSRTKYMGLYAQDSWRITPELTLNYGLRWEFSQPWYDTQGKIETIVPGEQSVLFPGAPRGWVVPGDPGIPKTLANTDYHNFAPRVGLAYSPGRDSGWIAKLTGGPGKTSIRLGYGLFYTSVEDLTQFLEVGDAPFGLFWVSPAPPLFETPYIDLATGNNEGQKFPFVIPAGNVSAQHPDTSFNWAQVEPISSGFVFYHKNLLPYGEHYEFSLQRQFRANTVLSLNYVGTQGHRLLTSLEANPGDPALCLQLNQLGVTPACGPNGENTVYVLPPGVGFPSDAPPIVQTTAPCANTAGTCNAVSTTRVALGPNFGSNPYEAAMANSVYNSFQTSLRHTSGLSTFLIGYTFSKCLDNASGLQDTTYPLNYKLSRSLCDFDVTQNFGASYDVRVPFDRLFHADSGFANKITSGWSVSGITTFVTGLPVTLSENDDLTLIGTGFASIDLPNVTKGQILSHTNPRSGLAYFNTALFSPETLGHLGDADRRFFHGPGLNNWDLALLKDTNITESKVLEFRFEAFNAFNHAQFQNPNALINNGAPDFVNGVNVGGNFGLVQTANDPRIMQAALKFRF